MAATAATQDLVGKLIGASVRHQGLVIRSSMHIGKLEDLVELLKSIKEIDPSNLSCSSEGSFLRARGLTIDLKKWSIEIQKTTG